MTHTQLRETMLKQIRPRQETDAKTETETRKRRHYVVKLWKVVGSQRRTFKVPLSLLTTSVASASCSTSSAMMSRG